MQLKRFCVDPIKQTPDAFYLLTAQTVYTNNTSYQSPRLPRTILFGTLGEVPGVLTFVFRSDSKPIYLCLPTGLESEDRIVNFSLESSIGHTRVWIEFQSGEKMDFLIAEFQDEGFRVLKLNERDLKAHPELKLLSVERARKLEGSIAIYLICLQVPPDFDLEWKIDDVSWRVDSLTTIFGLLCLTRKDPGKGSQMDVYSRREFIDRLPEIGEEVFEGTGVTFQGCGHVFPFMSSIARAVMR